MGTMTSQITGVSIVCSAVCSCADQRKYQSSASLAFVRGIYRRPVNFPHKGPVTPKMFPFDDVIIGWRVSIRYITKHVMMLYYLFIYILHMYLFCIARCVIQPLVYDVKYANT